MSDLTKLTAATRTEFGKGAARRARREGNVPAVLYGHGTDPLHLSLVARDFAKVLRNNGTNAIIALDVDGEEHLALTKQVVVHPLRNYIEHADLLVIKRGEKVTVEVPVLLEGDAAAGTQVSQDASTIELLAPAMSIPEQIILSIEGVEAGTMIVASQLVLPEGVELTADPETLIVNITESAKEEAEEDEATEAE